MAGRSLIARKPARPWRPAGGRRYSAADLSLIVVNYFSSNLTARAIESSHLATSRPLQRIVVDNSGDEGEASALESLPIDRLVRLPNNPGYGSAANAGADCASGDLLIANPDIVFTPGSIDRLAAALMTEKVGMAGPRFVWDQGGEWHLPPPARPSCRQEVARLFAGWLPAAGRRWQRARRTERIEFWTRSSVSEVPVLSGALLAIRREAFDDVGGFDPAFRLYFEEIDLALRLRKRGWRVLHVPDAVCRHLYNQSAGRSAEARRFFLESEKRFLSKWYGPRSAERFFRWRRAVTGIEVPLGVSPHTFELSRARWLTELSPTADFASAAGLFHEGGTVTVPSEILDGWLGGDLYVRNTNLETGRSAGVRVIQRRVP
ncbi:MAG TPA: glycosyltransferase family 2 protein [Thermoanaerobaculia bacterium]|nr:glycosyltransferase family 2 protein [Thermoanaerobaculia bacterium]